MAELKSIPDEDKHLENQLKTPDNYGSAASSPVSQQTDDSISSTKNRSWTRDQKLTAVAMALMNFSTQVSFAVIAPFYPVEAAKKGATSTEIGFIFGIFQLVIFITAPLYGKYVSKMFCYSLVMIWDKLVKN